MAEHGLAPTAADQGGGSVRQSVAPDALAGQDSAWSSAIGGRTWAQVGEEPELKRRPWHEVMPTFVKELLAGGAAGGVAKTAVAPLERVKILVQTRQEKFHSAGVWGSLKNILQTEGVRGFYRGNAASVARVVPYAALHFMTYEQYRRWIVAGHASETHSPRADLLAGSLAGATAVVCTYPLDLIRTRLAYQVPGVGLGRVPTPGIWATFRGMLAEGGVRALYSGLGPTLWGILPYAGLKFYMYESLKAALPAAAADQPPSVAAKLTCGGVAGLVAQTITYPLDVVRRQMQVQGAPSPFSPAGPPVEGLLPPARPRYRGTWDGIVTIARTQGWRQLYAGLSINYLKMAPSVAVGFTIYDTLKSWLGVPPRSKGVSVG